MYFCGQCIVESNIYVPSWEFRTLATKGKCEKCGKMKMCHNVSDTDIYVGKLNGLEE